ncbi:MAG TPA: hypothetical protein VMM12_03290 [Longimicrobiales bacterium]|nr:hypothetical protein [Longimicrobiales bacterium]
MRRIFLSLLVLAGCAGPDSDPVDVAERFHAVRLAGDDRGIHALLTDADRATIPLEAFPAALPPRLALELLGWGAARLDSASLLSAERDTAAVLLHVAGVGQDTLRLIASHHPRRFWLFELDRLRWRVSIGVAERALLDSLATALRADADDHAAAVAHARAYVEAAERHPANARPADLAAARTMLRKDAIAGALHIELRVDDSFTGTRIVAGRVENPTRTRVGTLRLTVRDEAGGEEHVELWDIAPGTTATVSQVSRLRKGPATYRVERIRVF